MTQGSQNVILIETENDNVKESSFEVPAIPKENIVDTNGAGDSFVGGFLAAKIEGKPIDECIKAGIHMSGIVVQRLGCQFE